MRTVAARALNELFTANIFRLALTFHGGTNVLGYEWGDYSHCEKDGNCEAAPDHAAMDLLARRMQAYAGPAGEYEKEYKVGDMGSTVYPVNGGMEDWAYGASWAEDRDDDHAMCIVTNDSSEVGEYAGKKTIYGDATHRCITYLVETATEKQPAEKTLGEETDEILDRDGVGNGHVPQNVRLALLSRMSRYTTFRTTPWVGDIG